MSYNVKTDNNTMWYKGEPIINYRIKSVIFLGYKEGIGKINEIIESEVNGYFKKIKESFYPKAAIVFDSNSDDEAATLPFELDFEITVEYESDEIISFTVKRSENTGGEGNELYKKAYTVDKNSGKAVRLGEVYNTNDLYGTISKEIEKEIANGEEGYLPDWRARVKKSLKKENFYLKNGKPVLWFDQYELMSYSYGIKEFELQ